MNCYYFWKNHTFSLEKHTAEFWLGGGNAASFFLEESEVHFVEMKSNEVLLYTEACVLHHVAHKP